MPWPRKPYNELPLIPAIVAERVLNAPHTGAECSNHSPSFVESVERGRLSMSKQQRERFIEYVDLRCQDAYERRLDWFLKLCRSRSNKGRDQLYVFVIHWLAAFIVAPVNLTRD